MYACAFYEIICYLSVFSGSNLTFIPCQRHSEGRESSAASDQLQSSQHALPQRQAAGQNTTELLSENPLLRVWTRFSSVYTGGGGQERSDLPKLCPALQNADVRHSEDRERLKALCVFVSAPQRRSSNEELKSFTLLVGFCLMHQIFFLL